MEEPTIARSPFTEKYEKNGDREFFVKFAHTKNSFQVDGKNFLQYNQNILYRIVKIVIMNLQYFLIQVNTFTSIVGIRM